MWDDEKRQRFRTLDNKKWNAGLTEAEQEEWAALVAEVEAEEVAYLRPATERIRKEREETEAKNRELKALAERKARLVARLESILAEAQVERQAISEETIRLLGSIPIEAEAETNARG